MPCVHKQIEAALDRWQEVHWQIHQIEQHYHDPAGVRYSFNGLIRAAKEIPQILSMELQNRPDYREHLKPKLKEIKADPLFKILSDKRDFLVHRGMLEASSSGMIGTTEGKGWKFGMSFPVLPSESSEDAYARFVEVCKSDDEVRRMLGPDSDSWPMLERKWCIPEFPDDDLLQVAIDAWLRSGRLLSEVLVHLGGSSINMKLECTHSPDKVQRIEFSQEEFFRIVDGIDLRTGKRI